jgi:hypothetical protein
MGGAIIARQALEAKLLDEIQIRNSRKGALARGHA